MEFLKNLPFNFFDIVTLGMLILGLFRGRKHGMSEELLPLLESLLMLVLASSFYSLGAGILASSTSFFTVVTANVTVYIGIVLLVYGVFSAVKRVVGEKLVGADLFGKMEYYFGMAAGVLRFAVWMLMGLAILNAPLIPADRIASDVKTQQQNFGSISFPTFPVLQKQILHDSWTGHLVQSHFQSFLIKPAESSERSSVRERGIGRQREKALDDALGGKK